jgi:hypothetical protein
LLCLDPPYPNPAFDIGHYTGISKKGFLVLQSRLQVQAEGGSDAARLLQVQKAAGGTFHLVSVEWGTQDRETARKYRAATDRCSRCRTGPPPPGEPPPELGWVCIVHLEPSDRQKARSRGPETQQHAHQTVFIPSTEGMYKALGQGGRDIAEVLQLPEARGGTWRLTKAELAATDRAADRMAWITPRRARTHCPLCQAEREKARADELLAAIERGEVARRFAFCLYHPSEDSWAARWHTRDGQKMVGDDPDGYLGRNVSRIAAVLVRRGLVKVTDGPPHGASWDAEHADRPYLITRAGRAELRGPRPRRRSAGRPPWPRRQLPAPAPKPRADGLPVRRDGGLHLAKCTDEERAQAGVMTRKEARDHQKLRSLDLRTLPDGVLGPEPEPRRAERLRRPADDDEWMIPALPPGPPAALGAARSLDGTSAPAHGSGSQLLAAVIPPGPLPGSPRQPITDPSWPSTAWDGVAAAAELASARASRPAASARRAADRSRRGAGR